MGAAPPLRLAARSGPSTAEARPTRASLPFHRALAGYRETPLRILPEAATALGLEGLYVKDESKRLGLPSFKVLGASWAIYRLLAERLGGPPPEPTSVAALRAAHGADADAVRALERRVGALLRRYATQASPRVR